MSNIYNALIDLSIKAIHRSMGGGKGKNDNFAKSMLIVI